MLSSSLSFQDLPIFFDLRNHIFESELKKGMMKHFFNSFFFPSFVDTKNSLRDKIRNSFIREIEPVNKYLNYRRTKWMKSVRGMDGSRLVRKVRFYTKSKEKIGKYQGRSGTIRQSRMTEQVQQATEGSRKE
jgi:hypothetical protein